MMKRQPATKAPTLIPTLDNDVLVTGIGDGVINEGRKSVEISGSWRDLRTRICFPNLEIIVPAGVLSTVHGLE